MVTQVCATGARIVFAGASEVQLGMSKQAIVVAGDRCSNGPHIYYPAPKGIGGYGQSEDQVVYNMMNDANWRTFHAEDRRNVAAKYQISTAEQNDVTLQRYHQYQDALADDQAFRSATCRSPLPIPKYNFKGDDGAISGDEGVFVTTAEGLAKLKPVLPEGTVTFGTQTHPADGNVGMVIASPERAKELSKDPNIRIRLRGFGQARADIEYMPEAPIEASRKALAHAGVKLTDLAAIKSHNPFAVNDIAFARATGADVTKMNNYGCSLIWGHPQGPTGLRAIVEMIEELAIKGGGLGLFRAAPRAIPRWRSSSRFRAAPEQNGGAQSAAVDLAVSAVSRLLVELGIDRDLDRLKREHRRQAVICSVDLRDAAHADHRPVPVLCPRRSA